MAADKTYGKIDTEFTAIQMGNAPNPAAQVGQEYYPGVCEGLRTPADQGVVDYANNFYTPRGPAPSIQGQSPSERIDTEFERESQMAVGPYNWNPGNDSRGNGSNALDSTFGENPFSMNVGSQPQGTTPTTPGAHKGYGGGQNPDGTPVGPHEGFGGGQG
jgi:hypothetical protein